MGRDGEDSKQQVETRELESRARREHRALLRQVMCEETEAFLRENRSEIIERAERRVRKVAEDLLDEEVRKLITEGEVGAKLP